MTTVGLQERKIIDIFNIDLVSTRSCECKKRGGMV